MFHISHLLMSALRRQNSIKIFDGSKLSKLTLKTKWYQLLLLWLFSTLWTISNKCVTDKYFEKKVTFGTIITFRYRKCMLPLQYLSYWCLHGVMFDLNSRGKTSKIDWLFKSNLRSFGHFKCSTALWLFLDPSCKGNLLSKLAEHCRPRLSPNAHRAFAGICIQILDTTLILVQDWVLCHHVVIAQVQYK